MGENFRFLSYKFSLTLVWRKDYRWQNQWGKRMQMAVAEVELKDDSILKVGVDNGYGEMWDRHRGGHFWRKSDRAWWNIENQGKENSGKYDPGFLACTT